MDHKAYSRLGTGHLFVPTPAVPLSSARRRAALPSAGRRSLRPAPSSPSSSPSSSSSGRSARRARVVTMALSRRALLLRALAAMPSAVAVPRALGLQSGEMHAELSELASKIPGAGMPDVYYPDFFQGDWIVTRELYAVETPDTASSSSSSSAGRAGGGIGSGGDWVRAHTTLSEAGVEVARGDIGRRQNFHLRFYSHRGHLIEDRAYNLREETRAAARGAARTAAALRVRPADGQRVDVTWDADNANVSTISWAAMALAGTPVSAGRRVVREAKVTKRAFVDGPQGYGTFVASEYARVVDFDGESALLGFGKPPSIYGRRRIVRYKVSSLNKKFEPDGMDRIVVEYLYPPNPPDAKAAVILKYRDFLNRETRLTDFVGG